ncbi:hypothetical protein [Celeribacter indicus]|uniref:Calcium-binding EF-hand n=1 Tax=Celeribacter indicus TaxID=1208324 RepID=A0A0B5DNL5_9RHOB|nr:hypothetical protein [Celeribacter indicus]AJE44779.1 calcium-binding EF-hand [Celeribacter indicus]SDX46784.1 EF hand [Celeribacter indicus]
MKTIALGVTTAAALMTTPLFAQTMIEDTDGSGTYSMAELSVAYPELTEDMFIAIDADGSGDVSPEELGAAQANGVLPTTE